MNHDHTMLWKSSIIHWSVTVTVSLQGTVDAVVVAAQLVTALQAIVSRNLSPTESGVITVGKIEGGCAPNVIASRVRLMGTVRASDWRNPQVRKFYGRCTADSQTDDDRAKK